MLNRIVTRGFGPSRGQAGDAGPVTMGYGGVTLLLPTRRYVPGRSGRRLERNDDIVVGAKLVYVNEQTVSVPIVSGRVVVDTSKDNKINVIVERDHSRDPATWENDVKISVKIGKK